MEKLSMGGLDPPIQLVQQVVSPNDWVGESNPTMEK